MPREGLRFALLDADIAPVVKHSDTESTARSTLAVETVTHGDLARLPVTAKPQLLTTATCQPPFHSYLRPSRTAERAALLHQLRRASLHAEGRALARHLVPRCARRRSLERLNRLTEETTSARSSPPTTGRGGLSQLSVRFTVHQSAPGCEVAATYQGERVSTGRKLPKSYLNASGAAYNASNLLIRLASPRGFEPLLPP